MRAIAFTMRTRDRGEFKGGSPRRRYRSPRRRAFFELKKSIGLPENLFWKPPLKNFRSPRWKFLDPPLPAGPVALSFLISTGRRRRLPVA